MGDIGDSWKLIVYPIAFILFWGMFSSFIVQPFIDEGIPSTSQPSVPLVLLQNLVSTGSLENQSITFSFVGFSFGGSSIGRVIYNFLVPDVVKEFILSQVTTLAYFPTLLQVPILILLCLSMALAMYGLIVALIP